LYTKNAMVFGRFTLSSWVGMNLARMTVEQLSPEERRRLVASGSLSAVSLNPSFAPIEAYGDQYVAIPGYENVAALRQVKRTTGFRNYNHLGYLAVSDRYRDDAIAVLRHHGSAYLRAVRAAWLQYLRPGHDLYLLQSLPSVEAISRLYDSFVYGRVSLEM